jgi:thiamine biosynthesis lipoprotein
VTTRSLATPAVRVEHLWGTAISLHVCDPVPAVTADAVFAWFRHVDDVFSTWRPDSEISRLGRGELRMQDASDEMREVLALCERVREESNGAFDAQFGADPRVTPREGFGRVVASGLEKGWSLQAAADPLRAQGAHNFAINAGGDVIASGVAASGAPWRVGVQHPSRRDSVALVLGISGFGVATSGRYERGDHIIDPRTGAPATALSSVTVVHENLALADGYATAALALGADGAAWLAERRLAAAVITNDEVVLTTPELAAFRLREATSP